MAPKVLNRGVADLRIKTLAFTMAPRLVRTTYDAGHTLANIASISRFPATTANVESVRYRKNKFIPPSNHSDAAAANSTPS